MEKKYLVIIKADTNDGDYIESSSYVKELDLQVIKKIAKAIESVDIKDAFNWYTLDGRGVTPRVLYKGVLQPEEIELFYEYIPYGENGIHSIVSIKVLEVSGEEVLL